MRSLSRALLFSFLAATAAGCLDAPEAIEGASAPILGGTGAAIGDFPTVVAVENAGLCTGTLVDPSWVLTAAHCISPAVLGYSSQAQVTANTIVVLDTDNVFSGAGRNISAADTIPHPSFSLSSLGDNDIGLIRLAQPVTDRVPSPINRLYDDALPGVVVTQVGYGVTQAGNQSSAGRLYVLDDKQSVACGSFGGSDTNLICFSQVDGTGKCEGDSGGPSFATIGGVQRVVGVTSFGDQNCAQFGADTRVDGELSFLADNAPELQCQADGACFEGCGGALPEDPDCAELCDVASDCEDPDDHDCVDGVCVAKPFSPGGLGSPCTNSAECDSGLCASDSDGGRCTDYCTADGGECPNDFACEPAGDQNVCWPASGGGGCRVGGRGASGSAGTSLLVLLALALWRRRSRSR